MVMFHSYVSLPEGNWHVPVHTFNSCQFHESETWPILNQVRQEFSVSLAEELLAFA